MVNLEIISNIEDDRWTNFIEDLDINNIFNNVIDFLGYKINNNKIIELSITFTNDKEIQELNREYRDKDNATNVLSFPLYEKEFLEVVEKEDYIILGDIVLSFDTIKKESDNFQEHLIHLIIHSILHLFGFDHIEEEEAEEMENIEIKILEKMGINNPYI